MKPENPAERIRLIEDTMICFFYSLCGFVPLLGGLLAFFALVRAIRIRTRSRGVWNPAQRYLNLAFAFAAVGLLVSLLLGGWLQLVVMRKLGLI